MKIEDMDLGTAIDTLYEKRSERLALEKTVKAFKTEELALRVRIKSLLDQVNLEGAKGSLATASISNSVEPTIVNWEEFYAYVKANDAFDMLQRRISPTAIKQRWEIDVVVPGVDKFDTWDISLTKRSK